MYKLDLRGWDGGKDWWRRGKGDYMEGIELYQLQMYIVYSARICSVDFSQDTLHSLVINVVFLLVTRLTKKKPKRKSVEVEKPATTATPVTDPSISEQRSTTERERESLRLEEDLDAAVRNASTGDAITATEKGRVGSSVIRHI